MKRSIEQVLLAQSLSMVKRLKYIKSIFDCSMSMTEREIGHAYQYFMLILVIYINLTLLFIVSFFYIFK